MNDKPCAYNRKVKLSVFSKGVKYPYALEEIEKREAVILFNTATRKTAERTIEYFL